MKTKKATHPFAQPRVKLDGDKHSKAEPSSLLQNFVHLPEHRCRLIFHSCIAQERALYAIRSPSSPSRSLLFCFHEYQYSCGEKDSMRPNPFWASRTRSGFSSNFQLSTSLHKKISQALQKCSLADCRLKVASQLDNYLPCIVTMCLGESCSQALSLMAVVHDS